MNKYNLPDDIEQYIGRERSPWAPSPDKCPNCEEYHNNCTCEDEQ